MLWCPLYVNDRMIGHASAQRMSGGTHDDDVNTYKATVTGHFGELWHGTITHRYGDGGWELIRKVLAAAGPLPEEGPP